MLRIIGAALNAIIVHITMVRGCYAPIAAFPAGRESLPDRGTAVVKIETTMTRNKQEFGDNTPSMLLVNALVRTLTITRLQ